MRRRRLWITLIVVGAVLVAVRLALPSIIERIVEGKLEDMPGGYRGTLERVDVRMLNAEIGLQGFTVTKKDGDIPVPFMHVEEFVLATVREGWRLRSVMRFVQPTANFVDAASQAKKQTGPKHTIEDLRQKLPFELLRVELRGGTFHFRKYQTSPDMDVYLRDVDLTWGDLVGCLPPGNASCRSTLEGRGKVMDSGELRVSGRFDRKPEVDLHVEAHVRDLRAAELNPFLNEYVMVRAEGGTVELDVRYDRQGDRHEALLIPYLSEVEIEEAKGEETSFLREIGVAAAAGWFERKKGEKGIAIVKKPSGESEFEIVDRPTLERPPGVQD